MSPMYEYDGQECTLSDLARISNLHRETIQRRINMGWPIEKALFTLAGKKQVTIKKEDIGKTIPIVFREDLPVFQKMQPVIGKQYIATVCGVMKNNRVCQVFYVVQLENGKKLITYPGEFEELDKAVGT